MKIRGIIITTVVILAIVAVSTTTAAALSCSDDICVDPTGWWRDGGAFNANATTPIQAAVDNANAGETIGVAAGSYNENVDIATAHLTLRGEGAGVATVTAANSGDHVFEVTAGHVNISGFTATGATAGSYPRYVSGIYLNDADLCNISYNTASNNNHGIRLSYSSNNNMIVSNIASNNERGGIYLYKSSSNNTLVSNTANSNEYNGICLSYSSNNTLTSNNCSNNSNGIILCFSSNNTLTSNNCSNNSKGIQLWASRNNTLASNTANSNNRSGIHLVHSSNHNMLVNNTANSNNWDGIHLYYHPSNNTIAGNTANLNNRSGIYLYDRPSNNTLLSNTANSNNWDGIHLCKSSNNMLVSNIASNNERGIYLYSLGDNEVTCNLVQNNTDCGIYLASGSTGNNITWNNIVANGELQTDGSYYYQFKNSQSDGVDAINNFWGAGMNSNTIDASIYDDEEGQAEVEFYPFATEPVPCAPAPISEEPPAFTTADAVIALEIAVGSRPLDLYWDVSGDGQVTSLDALMIVMDARTG